MLSSVSRANFSLKSYGINGVKKQKTNSTNATNAIQFKGADKNISAAKLADAYKGYNNVRLASSVSFTGSLSGAFEELNQKMKTCVDENSNGEVVGSRIDINGLYKLKDDLPRYDDAIKTIVEAKREKVEDKDTGKVITAVADAKYQIENAGDGNLKFIATRRPLRDENDKSHRTNPIEQLLSFEYTPYDVVCNDENERSFIGTPEATYVLNTKGNLMAVVEDNDSKDVLLTNAGEIHKKDSSKGKLDVKAKEYTIKDENGKDIEASELIKRTSTKACENGEDKSLIQIENTYKPFVPENVPVLTKKSGGSQGGGTELVIGLEQGRFVPEIIDSIKTFENKINDGDIVLDEFKPAEGAQNIQLSMLAGGFGSRAEYTNASSSKIFHGKKDGSNLTKGCFRTATGLTPMETTFISLHKAGLLDCSKGNFGIGKNIKFYLNDSNVNGGNGGFTVDMYKTMERENRESLFIMPNDAMSRIPNAVSKAVDIMNSGKAAVVMVAKEVNKEDARGKLGIMKIDDEGKIVEFAEKPKKFEKGYVDQNGNCFANTFQFAVSKEAFEALSILNPYLPNAGKEPKDWSKTYTPILMGLTQNDTVDGARAQINGIISKDTPDDVLQKAKDALGNQKIYAVKTDEPWADCGTLNSLYHTTMQIAAGDFPLEDFERLNVLDCVDTQTGLVASSKEQKERIEKKYNTKGQVMVVPKAEPVDKSIVDTYDFAITRYSDKNKKSA